MSYKSRLHFSLMSASIAVLIAASLSIGCAGNSTTTNPPLPVPAINGNFSITATSLGTSGLNFFGGAVQTDSSGHVTGTVHVNGSFFLCFGIQLDLPLAGAIDSTGKLNATITSSNGQTITLNGQVSPNGSFLSGGTYTGSGTGCASGDHGTISGFQVQPFTGAYSGAFSPAPATTVNFAITLAQSTTADSHGRFAFAPATAAITGGTACGLASATLDTALSEASGNTMALALLGSDGTTSVTFVGITTDGTTKAVAGQFNINSGPCIGQAGLAVLSHP